MPYIELIEFGLPGFTYRYAGNIHIIDDSNERRVRLGKAPWQCSFEQLVVASCLLEIPFSQLSDMVMRLFVAVNHGAVEEHYHIAEP